MIAHERYTVFNQLIEGVQVINSKWEYIYVNDALVRQSKYSRDQLLGKTMMQMYPGIGETPMFQCLRRCMEHRQFEQLENEFQFPDGSKGWFELRIQPVDEGILIMSFDITDRKRMEIQLQRFKRQLDEMVEERTHELVDALEREQVLNELKSRFVSIVSHELKTPLGAIEMGINILESSNGDGQSERRNAYYKQIRGSIRDMFNLINDFLSLEKFEAGTIRADRKPMDLRGLVESLIRRLEDVCKDQQRIVLTYLGDRIQVVDEQIIRSIVINLLSNAIKYSDESIYILVEAGHDDLSIQVHDRGIGIPEDEQDQMFGKFFRAKNARDLQGTGLGLNIVKRYTDMLDGSISFNSQPGEGTTFVVSIPQIASPVEEKIQNS